jgi:hypothetical protein
MYIHTFIHTYTHSTHTQGIFFDACVETGAAAAKADKGHDATKHGNSAGGPSKPPFPSGPRRARKCREEDGNDDISVADVG